MNKSTYEPSRSRRRNSQPQKPNQSNKGKNLFTLLSILFVLGVFGGGYWIFTIKNNEVMATEHFADNAKVLLADIQEERDQSGLANKKTIDSSDQLKVVVYTPQKANLPFEDLEKDLQTITEKNKEQTKKDEMAVIVSKVTLRHLTDQMDRYQIISERYRWNEAKREFIKEETLEDSPLYASQQTGKMITAKDLIPSEADLLGIQQVIQQKILDQSDDKTMIDKVLALPAISFDSEFTYSPEKLTVVLPKNDTGVDKITLDYKEIAAFINTEFVDPSTIEGALPTLDPNKKYAALTFDDGPNPATTPKLLDFLKEKNVKATFFMIGENVTANKEIAKRIHEEGHEVGSHTYTHTPLPGLSQEQIQTEVRKTDKAIFEATGVLPQNIRAPYGAVDVKTARITAKPFIEWSVDSADWQTKNTESIKRQVLSQTYNGTLILMHDIHPETVDAVPAIIDGLQKEGYELVTVDTLLSSRQKPLHQYFGVGDERVVD